MHSTLQRSPTLVNVCDFNSLYLRERNANLNTKNYLSTKSVVSPISGRNLRLVVTNGISSNILILPRTSSSTQRSFVQREKKESKKSFKPSGYDVYRSLARSMSQCSSNFDREMNYDEATSLSNSITVDRISPLSNTGLFRTYNLPKIPKQQIKSNNNAKSTQILKTISDRIDYIRATPDHPYYQEEKKKILTPTPGLSCIPKDQTRKELHVYMPVINC